MDHPFANKALEGQVWDIVICADAGMNFCREAKLLPDVILGDFDSAKPEDLKYFREICPDRIHTFPSEKDETDTELAVDCAIRRGADRITILGGTGTRLDHMAGNLQLLLKALDANVECFLVDSHNRVRMIRDPLTLDREDRFGDYVSLIPFTPEVEGLTLTGFVYEVENFTLKCGMARGISNEIRDEKAQITFRSGILLVVESMD